MDVCGIFLECLNLQFTLDLGFFPEYLHSCSHLRTWLLVVLQISQSLVPFLEVLETVMLYVFWSTACLAPVFA